jgi:hypothetical protein
LEDDEGGNRGRLISISEFAANRGIERTHCVIDRDGFHFVGFDFNSHCLITDLASLDMYALDIDELRGYLSRSLQFEMTAQQMNSIIVAAKSASSMQWARELHVKNVALANVERSLSIENNSLVQINLTDWLDRSRVRGGSTEEWDALNDEIPTILALQAADPRKTVSVHKLDDVVRFWLRRVKSLSMPDGWLEGHLRGLATYDRLKQFPFFVTLELRCRAGIA